MRYILGSQYLYSSAWLEQYLLASQAREGLDAELDSLKNLFTPKAASEASRSSPRVLTNTVTNS